MLQKIWELKMEQLTVAPWAIKVKNWSLGKLVNFVALGATVKCTYFRKFY